MARKPEKKIKFTQLEKSMMGKMQSQGKLIRRYLTSWEKRSANGLVKKGVFQELPSNQEYFRTYTFSQERYLLNARS